MHAPDRAAAGRPIEVSPAAGDPGDPQRLWTPWRMRYVGGDGAERGCLFCNRLAAGDDVESLILHRADHAFVIMNLFPYNTGHVMIVPNEHVASPESASDAALSRIALLLPPALATLRRVLNADGFNVGMNVGAVAGAGVADHLHQHVVPRWVGDANFMPILASTMVLPELIPVTYAKTRAELARGLRGDQATVALVVLDVEGTHVLVAGSRRTGVILPRTEAAADEPVWRAALRTARDLGVPAEIAGWAGPTRATAGGPLGLTLRATQAAVTPSAGAAFRPVTEAKTLLTAAVERTILQLGLDHLPGMGATVVR